MAMAEPRVKRVLCILPKSVAGFWDEEIRRIRKCWPSLDRNLIVQRFKGEGKKRNRELRANRKKGKPIIVIVSNALVDIPVGGTSKDPLFPTGNDKDYPWDFIVLDEVSTMAVCRIRAQDT